MPSTYTDSLRLEQQGIGENNNTWGNRLNTTIAAIDQAIAGAVEIALTTGTEVLESLNNDIDEARAKTLRFTGSLTGNVMVQAPAQAKEYLISDETTRNGFTIDVRLGTSGATVSIESAADFNVIFTDGTSWWRMVGDGAGEFRTNGQNDDRFAQLTNNLSDLNSASTARTNLGLGTAAVEADTKYAHRANNLSDVADAPTARTNLGLGTAATQDTGAGNGLDADLLDGQEADTFVAKSGTTPTGASWYEETSLSLDNQFSGGDVKIIKVGNLVTLTTTSSLTHSVSSGNVNSSTGLLPSQFRPAINIDVCTKVNNATSPPHLSYITVESNGTITLRHVYMDDGAPAFVDGFLYAPTISYCV